MLDQRPSKELRARKSTRRRAERRSSVAYSIRFTDAFNLCQYGLTSSQPDGGVKKAASLSVVWTVALNFIGFSIMKRMGFDFFKGRWSPVVATIRRHHKGKKDLDSPSGETARRRKGGHHTLDVRFLKQPFVSNLGKLENWHSK